MNITEQDFSLFKHNPVSKVFRKFLQDYREMLIKETMAQWESGALKLSTEENIRGRLQAITEILNLEYEHIKQFYEDNSEIQNSPIRQNS